MKRYKGYYQELCYPTLEQWDELKPAFCDSSCRENWREDMRRGLIYPAPSYPKTEYPEPPDYIPHIDTQSAGYWNVSWLNTSRLFQYCPYCASYKEDRKP